MPACVVCGCSCHPTCCNQALLCVPVCASRFAEDDDEEPEYQDESESEEEDLVSTPTTSAAYV